MQAGHSSWDRGRGGEQHDKHSLHWRKHSHRTKDRPTHSPKPTLTTSSFSLSVSYMYTDTVHGCFTWLCLTHCFHVGMKINCRCNCVKRRFPSAVSNVNPDADRRKLLMGGGRKSLSSNTFSYYFMFHLWNNDVCTGIITLSATLVSHVMHQGKSFDSYSTSPMRTFNISFGQLMYHCLTPGCLHIRTCHPQMTHQTLLVCQQWADRLVGKTKIKIVDTWINVHTTYNSDESIFPTLTHHQTGFPLLFIIATEPFAIQLNSEAQFKRLLRPGEEEKFSRYADNSIIFLIFWAPSHNFQYAPFWEIPGAKLNPPASQYH